LNAIQLIFKLYSAIFISLFSPYSIVYIR